MAHTTAPLPAQSVPVDRMPGHWLLARLGKRVLRPGGRELTERLLSALAIGSADDVVELAPGLGSTTELVLGANPRSYVGVDRDPVSARRVAEAVQGPNRRVVEGSAAATGLEDASADVVFGEAYLTMQSAGQKARIAAELARIIRPGGRLGLHEVAIAPETPADRQEAIRSELTSAIKVPVSPLPLAGWEQLLVDAGFEVEARFDAPLHLLEPRRLVADEGALGAARFVGNVLRHPAERRRVLAMRAAMHRNAAHLGACALVARRRAV
jgi:SAM-dependent methyltransferase